MTKLVTLTACLACAILAAAEPFAGQWKIRMDKSSIPMTYKFLAVGEGKFQTDNGLALGPVLPADGSAHESPLGGMVSLKRIDDHTYIYTLKRKSLYKRTMTLNSDKMKWAEDQELDTGKHNIFESQWVRTGHADGLAGEWHRVSISDPQDEKESLIIAAIPNGLSFKTTQRNLIDKTYFDGKEHASIDPDDVSGIFDVAERLDVHSFRDTEKRNGKVIATVTCQLSDDENTITWTRIDDKNQKVISVFERLGQ